MSGLVLALDTSTDVLVGVARDGEVLARAQVHDPRQHVEKLTPLVLEALAAAHATLADVTQVVVGLGPGPYTGLRVGIVTARTIAATLRVPLHGVCSLDVVAAAWVRDGEAPDAFVVASDARRKELYWACYDATGARVDGPRVTYPADLPDLPVVGPGADLYPDVLADRAVDGPRTLDAGLLAALGDALPDAGVEPLYLRRPDAAVSTTRKSTLLPRKLPRS